MAHTGSKVLSFKCGNLEIKEIQKIRDFAQDLVSETEEMIANVIPAKILYLDKLCKSDLFKKKESVICEINIPRIGLTNCANTNDIAPSHEDGEMMQNRGKKRKLDADADFLLPAKVPINSHLTPLIEALKPEIQELIRTSSKVQIWIQLLIPKIEDGNNFGVSIQEEILNEVNRIQTEATGYLDQISRYYITRGKLLSKIAKYPYLEDYRQTIKEVDEKEVANLQMNGCELRNHYLLLLDSISKNYEKIKRPRSCNTDSMY